MANTVSAKASREEETAFLAMEQILDVDIRLADAGGGNSMPDGIWRSPVTGRTCIVEITSPPATQLMRELAEAKRDKLPHMEGGSVPVRWGKLADVCQEYLEQPWALANIQKLLAQSAQERHLYLHGRKHADQHYFRRLSDVNPDGSYEAVGDLTLPEGISDVWFDGRAQRIGDPRTGQIEFKLARYQTGSGWHRYTVTIEQLELPPPPPSLAADTALLGARHPKDRTPAGTDV